MQQLFGQPTHVEALPCKTNNIYNLAAAATTAVVAVAAAAATAMPLQLLKLLLQLFLIVKK